MNILFALFILFAPLIPVFVILGFLFWLDGRRDKQRLRQQLCVIENQHRARDRELYGSGTPPAHLRPIALEDMP